MSTQRRAIHGHSIRWNEDRARAAYEQGHWVQTTLADSLSTAAAEHPGRVLVVEGETRLTASELHARASALAGVMAARFPPGGVITFMLPNWHEAAIIYLAATLAGMVAHPVLPSLRAHDLRFILQDVHSRMIFIPQVFRGHDCAQMLLEVTAEMEAPPEVIVVRGDGTLHAPFDLLLGCTESAPLPVQNADAVRMIMYTSGTTGRPKGVMHSHNSIHALIRQLGAHWLTEPGDSFLVASPISHIGGSIYAFECPLLLGTTAVLMEQWHPDTAVQQLVEQHCTHFAGATPFLTQTLASARAIGTRLPDLKLFICGGASVPPSLIQEAAEYFERAIVTRVYGSTEVPVTTVGALTPGDSAHAATTDGQPGIADIRLIDGQGEATEHGEVRARGPQMLVGYVHVEDEEAAFDADGYYRTGDLGDWVDGDYLVISGRIKDLIIRNGENIAPKEIEDILLDHPDIREIAIVGLPHPKTGERACAVIVPNGQARPDINALREFLDARGVAKFKVPEQVELWEALPKNDAGKVLKQKIREVLASFNKSSPGI